MTPRLEDIADACQGGPCVVARLHEAAGSTPRETGAWMAVTRSTAIGTIGGGEAERRTVEAARRMIAEDRAHEMLELPLGPALDQCCGGHMRVELAALTAPPAERLTMPSGAVLTDPASRAVFVYGGGHVGTALVAALHPLPFALTWIDARDASVWPAEGPIPCERLAIPEAAVAEAPDDAFHVVLTHSHALDLEIVAAVLSRPFAFLGLIGSATKRATFTRRLAERGLDPARLTCPIGLAGISGKAPAVIAASVAAQLLSLESVESGERGQA